MRANQRPKGRGVLVIPRAMFRENGLRIGAGIEIGGAGEVAMNPRGLRIESMRPAVTIQSLGGSPMFLETITEIIQGIRVAGPDGEGVTVRGRGGIQIALRAIGVAEIEAGIAVSGIAPQGLPVFRDGLVDSPHAQQRVSEVAAGFKAIRLGEKRAAVKGGSFFDLSPALERQTEIGESAGMARLAFEDAPVCSDRLVHAARGLQGNASLIIGGRDRICRFWRNVSRLRWKWRRSGGERLITACGFHP